MSQRRVWTLSTVRKSAIDHVPERRLMEGVRRYDPDVLHLLEDATRQEILSMARLFCLKAARHRSLRSVIWLRVGACHGGIWSQPRSSALDPG